MIKNPEEAIGKVLAGLKTSDAPVGMERRILKAVQDQAAAQSQTGLRWLRPFWPVTSAPIVSRSLVFGVALTGILAVAFTVPSLYRVHRISEASSESKSAPTQEKRSAPAITNLIARTPPSRPVISAPVKKEKRRTSIVRRDDFLALREMRAPSRPAPPLPLTKQEKLLLHLVHTAGPEQLAMLDPEVRTKQEMERKAEFEKFFGQ